MKLPYLASFISISSFVKPGGLSIDLFQTGEKRIPRVEETGMPCAPVNSNVGEERRSSKASMGPGHVPSEFLGGKAMWTRVVIG